MTEAEKTHSYKTETALTKPRVVIIGGGFGGLCAARGLVGAPVSVTLIDKRNYHLFRPMLYQVATGLLSADQISRPLRSILSRQANVEVLMDEVSGVDTEKRLVRLKQHSISYDYLILATGIQYNYFGHDEWRHVAPGREPPDGADRARGSCRLGGGAGCARSRRYRGNTATARLRAGRRGHSGRGNGEHPGGDVADGVGA